VVARSSQGESISAVTRQTVDQNLGHLARLGLLVAGTA
jgi:hypothetical protein